MKMKFLIVTIVLSLVSKFFVSFELKNLVMKNRRFHTKLKDDHSSTPPQSPLNLKAIIQSLTLEPTGTRIRIVRILDSEFRKGSLNQDLTFISNVYECI